MRNFYILIVLLLVTLSASAGDIKEYKVYSIYPPHSLFIVREGEIIKSTTKFSISDNQVITFQPLPKGKRFSITGKERVTSIKEYFTPHKETKGPKSIDYSFINAYHESSFKDSTEKQERRVAMIIGNNLYEDRALELQNTNVDAFDISNKLDSLGFDTFTFFNLSREEIIDALYHFSHVNKGDYEVALFYYSGHGLLQNNENYIVPIDAKIKTGKEDLDSICVSLNDVIDCLVVTGCDTRLVFWDACRKGLSVGEKPSISPVRNDGSYIVFASDRDDIATQSGNDERNSPFTKAFLENVKKPHRTIDDLIRSITKSLEETCSGCNVPQKSAPGNVDFTFYDEIDLTKAKYAALKAHELYYEEGDPISAIKLLYNNIPQKSSDIKKPYSVEVEKELRAILNDTISIYRVLLGHKAAITQAYFSDDNNTLTTVSEDSTLRVWDINTGSQINCIANLEKPIVSPNRKYVISYSSQKQEFLTFDINTGSLVSSFEFPKESKKKLVSRAIDFTKDSEHIYVFDEENGGLSVFNIKNGSRVAHTDKYFSNFWCDLSSDGSKLAYTDKEINQNILELWDITSNKLIFKKEINAEEIQQALFSKDDKFIYTCDSNGDIIKWNTQNGKISFSINVGSPIESINDINKDESQMILLLSSGHYSLISLNDKKVIRELQDSYRPDFNSNQLITINRENKMIESWDYLNGNHLATFGPYIRNKPAASGKDFIIYTSIMDEIVLCDILSGKRHGTLHYNPNSLNGFVISPNDKYIFTADVNGVMSIWRINNNHKSDSIKTIVLPVSLFRIERIEISNEYLILGDLDSNIEVFNIEDQSHYILPCTNNNFEVNGKRLYVGLQDFGVKVYDLQTRRQIDSIFSPRIIDLSLSENGKTLAISTFGDSVCIYNTSNNRVKYLQEVDVKNAYISNLIISPNAEYASAYIESPRPRFVLWNVNTGNVLIDSTLNIKHANKIHFSPSSKFIIFSSTDGNVKLIKCSDGSTVATLSEPNKDKFKYAIFRDVIFSPNENFIVTYSFSKETPILIWNSKTYELMHSLSGGRYVLIDGMFSKNSEFFYAYGYMGNESNPSAFKLFVYDTSNWNLLYSKKLDDSIFLGDMDQYIIYLQKSDDRMNIVLSQDSNYRITMPLMQIIDETRSILNNAINLN